MPRTATLLMDLQVDFLSSGGGRMPVFEQDALRVIEAANAVLTGRSLTGCVPVLMVNQFLPSDWLANWFRRNAAMQGSPGAALDPRVLSNGVARVFTKRQPSAFSNADLAPYLKANGVSKVYVMGVFAAGCVRATAVEAKRLDYDVAVPVPAVGTSAEYKRRLANWAMRRAGVRLLDELPAIANAA